MVGTGVAGGLSTFSSFAYGTVVLMSGSAARVVVASAYVLSSLFLGYGAVVCGQQVLDICRESFRPTFAPFIETIDWNQASAFLDGTDMV